MKREDPESEASRIEREIRSRRSFSMEEAVGREGAPTLKGESPVAPSRRIQLAVAALLQRHLRDASGALRLELEAYLRDTLALPIAAAPPRPSSHRPVVAPEDKVFLDADDIDYSAPLPTPFSADWPGGGGGGSSRRHHRWRQRAGAPPPSGPGHPSEAEREAPALLRHAVETLLAKEALFSEFVLQVMVRWRHLDGQAAPALSPGEAKGPQGARGTPRADDTGAPPPSAPETVRIALRDLLASLDDEAKHPRRDDEFPA